MGSYYGLLGATASIRISSDLKSKLYPRESKWHFQSLKRIPEVDEEKVKDNIKNVFIKKNYELKTIKDLAQSAGLVLGDFSEASILNFKEKQNPSDDEIKRNRDDWNAKFRTTITENDNNEYFLMGNKVNGDYYNVLYDIAVLLKLKRIQLFGNALSKRIYNIFLPIGKITMKNSDKKSSFLIIPFVTLHRKPGKIQFRRTASINIIFIPIDKLEKRSFSNREIYQTLWEYGNDKTFYFENDSEFKNFISDYVEKNSEFDKLKQNDDEFNKFFKSYIKTEFSTVELIQNIAKHVLFLISGNSRKKGDLVKVNYQIRHSYQKISSCMTTYDDSERKLILSFDSSSDRYLELENELKTLIHPYHYFVDDIDHPLFQSLFDIKDLNVNDEYAFDSSSPEFYNPRDSYLLEQHFTYLEKFPRLSMKWMFVMNMYMLMEISLFKVMLNSFYHEIEKSGGLQNATDIERDLITDLDEFYDLDLAFNSYKNSYEKIKVIAGIDQSYKTVKDKLHDLTGYYGITQQRRINFAIIILTVFTVASTFLSIDYKQFDTWHIAADLILSSAMGVSIYLIMCIYGKAKNT